MLQRVKICEVALSTFVFSSAAVDHEEVAVVYHDAFKVMTVDNSVAEWYCGELDRFLSKNIVCD